MILYSYAICRYLNRAERRMCYRTSKHVTREEKQPSGMFNIDRGTEEYHIDENRYSLRRNKGYLSIQLLRYGQGFRKWT